MKTLNSTLKQKYSDLVPTCDPEKEIKHIMHEGQQVLLPQIMKAKDVSCPRCKSSIGFYIPDKQTWSCKTKQCIYENSPKHLPHAYQNNIPQQKTLSYKLCDQPETIMNRINAFWNNPRGFLVFHGHNGTGKTFLAQALYNDFDCDEKIFTMQGEMYVEWLLAVKNPEQLAYLIQRYSKADFLVIDDLGSRMPTEGLNETLLIILEKRFNTKKPTIFTSNLGSKQKVEQFGHALFSRITSGEIIKFEGPDRRRIVEY